MCQKSDFEFPATNHAFDPDVEIPLKNFELNKSLDVIWNKIKELDILINAKKVWTLEGSELQKVLEFLVNDIRQIAVDLKPFLPETSEKIEKQYKVLKIKSGDPLFPRLNTKVR